MILPIFIDRNNRPNFEPPEGLVVLFIAILVLIGMFWSIVVASVTFILWVVLFVVITVSKDLWKYRKNKKDFITCLSFLLILLGGIIKLMIMFFSPYNIAMYNEILK